jgi:hypothetical protein
VIETNIDEIGEYLDERDMYQGAHIMKRRQGDQPEGPGPSTYLALAVSAPDVGGRFGVRPMVTGADAVALPGSAWCTKVVGDELPLNYSIEELPALGGASAPLPGIEVADEAVSAGREDGANQSHRPAVHQPPAWLA